MITLEMIAPIDVNEPCCPDLSLRVCYSCRVCMAIRLERLARNIAVAFALCEAWELGYSSYPIGDCNACVEAPNGRCIDKTGGWAPGRGIAAPRDWLP